VMRALQRLLGPLSDLDLGGFVTGVVEAAVLPVTVRTEHAGILAIARRPPPARRLGAVEIAGAVMAGGTGEENLLDRVIVTVDLAVNHRLQGGLVRHGPQTRGHEDLFAQLLAASFPDLSGRRRRHGEVIVERFRLAEPTVFGPLSRFQHPRGVLRGGIGYASREKEKDAEKVSRSFHMMIPCKASLSPRR